MSCAFGAHTLGRLAAGTLSGEEANELLAHLRAGD